MQHDDRLHLPAYNLAMCKQLHRSCMPRQAWTKCLYARAAGAWVGSNSDPTLA